ncbi:MAG: hypothetical protein K0R73_1385 [Candidatus Midichloriaceae bacterium]|jgi:hypothetical protein|nr:hypothetical protein [Candidatus Midichloriaceae bacterium]
MKNNTNVTTLLESLITYVQNKKKDESLKSMVDSLATFNAQTINGETSLSTEKNKIHKVIFENADLLIQSSKTQQDAFAILEYVSGFLISGMESPLNTKMIRAFLEKHPAHTFQLSDALKKKYIKKLELLLELGEAPVNLEQFKIALKDLEAIGFDPKLVVTVEENYSSLLKSCLLNPTEENFDIFLYLIDEKIVKIEEQLNARSLSFDTQQMPSNPEAAAKFLEYIDQNTTIEQKNTCQLFNLAIFFNHKVLFKQLLRNPEIDISSPGQRNTTPLTDIFMNHNRSEITKAFIESERFTEEETGPLREDLLLQLFAFSGDEIVRLALQPNKFPSYSNFKPTLCRAIIDCYRLASSDKVSKYKLVDLMLLMDPSYIDEIYLAAKVQIPTLPKLLSFLEAVRDQKQFDFSKISQDSHALLLSEISQLSDSDINKLSYSLNIRGQEGIKDFVSCLKQLAGDGEKAFNAFKGIEKLETSLNSGLGWGRSVSKLFFNNPIKPLDISPIFNIDESDKVMLSANIQKRFERRESWSKVAEKASNNVGNGL